MDKEKASNDKLKFCKEMVSIIMDSEKEYDFEQIVPLAVEQGYKKEVILDYLHDPEFLDTLDDVFLGRLVLMRTQALRELQKQAKKGNVYANTELIRAANKKIEQERYKRLSQEYLDTKKDDIKLGLLRSMLIEQGKVDEVHKIMSKPINKVDKMDEFRDILNGDDSDTQP